jgi:hypothetical protein
MWKLLVLPLIGLLIGCGNRPIPAQNKPIIIPAAMFQCADAPDVPASPVSDVDTAVFIIRQAGALKDCQDTLSEVNSAFVAQGGETP